MFEPTRFVNADDLRQHRLGGDLHLVNSQCLGDGCSPVCVTVRPKIAEPGVGGVVRDGTGTYLHTGSSFTNHWRRVAGGPTGPGKDLARWDRLADDVVLVRPGINDVIDVDLNSMAAAASTWTFTRSVGRTSEDS